MSMILVIFEDINTSFSVIEIQNIIQYLRDTGFYFFIAKETKQRLGDKTLTAEQAVYSSQSISLIRLFGSFYALDNSKRFVTAIDSRTFLTKSQTGMQPDFTIFGVNGKGLFIKVPVNIRVCTELLNNCSR